VKNELGIAVLQSVEHFARMSEIWILHANRSEHQFGRRGLQQKEK